MRLSHRSHPRIECAETRVDQEAVQKHQFTEQTQLSFSAEQRAFLHQIDETLELSGYGVDWAAFLHDHAFRYCECEVIELPVKGRRRRGNLQKLQPLSIQRTGGDRGQLQEFWW